MVKRKKSSEAQGDLNPSIQKILVRLKKKKRRRCCGRLNAKGDLIKKILLRLPVESLLRFKLVCKSWCSIIVSSSFIDLHTTTTFNNSSSSSNNFGSFIFQASVDKPPPPPKRSPWPEPYKLSTEYSVDKTSRENSLIMLLPKSESGAEYSSKSKSKSGGGWWSTTGSNDEDRVFKVDNLGESQLVLQLDSLGVPPCYKDSYFFKKILGSCNGLLCLYDRDAHRFSLWNPATKQHRILPGPIEIGVDWPYKLMSFGFDVNTKDYKVVLINGFRQEFYRQPIDRLCRVQVYSLITDSWRLVEGINRLPGDPFQFTSEVLYLNGSCFFMAHFFRTKHYLPCIPENDRLIISFDLTKEIITPIQLPDHHQDQTLYLSCFAGKLALFTVKYQPRLLPCPLTGFCDTYSIWVLLNEHGNSSSSSNVNQDSWTKLHSFQITVQRPDERNIPRGISNDGRFALLEIKDSTGLGKRMKLYDCVSKEVKTNFLSCGSVGSKANAYKRSLVSIIGANDAA